MIELEGVSKYYHTGDIISMGLHNISLKLQSNEIVAIIGESGSGKSTLLNVITKLDTFDEGEIYYKGNETSYFSLSDMDDFRKNKIGFIFQNSNIIDSYTVLENVMLPLVLTGLDNKEAKKKALELIDKVGLSHRISSRGTKLSGGEKQRCVIARALASNCEILACDEPTGNLDSKTGEDIIKLIKEVAKDKLVLIVTHNYDQVKDIVTRKIRVADGQIVEDEVIKKIEEDKKEELNLDYKPLSKRVCAKIAKNNAVFTPKKTTLLSFIFLAICLGSLFLFQSIFNSSITTSKAYPNTSPNHGYVYKYDHSTIDEELLKKYDYDINPFYENCKVSFTLNNIRTFEFSGYTDRLSYTLVKGRKPMGAYEVIAIYPSSAIEENYYDDLSSSTFFIGDTKYTISGIGKSIYHNQSNPIFSGNEKMRDCIYGYGIASNLLLTSKTTFNNSINNIEFDANISKPIIKTMQKNTSDLSISLFNGLYQLDKNIFEIETVNSYSEQAIIYSKDSFKDVPIFEASVYGNIKSISRELSKKDLIVDECSKLTFDTPANVFLSNLFGLLLVISSSGVLIIINFISYVILSRVYASKKKDYEILRTLGVTKKDMRHVVYFEVMGVCLIITIISFIIFALLTTFVPKLHHLYELNVLTSIYYFILMTLFSFLTSRRFNKRLFKFSISKSLKGGENHD